MKIADYIKKKTTNTKTKQSVSVEEAIGAYGKMSEEELLEQLKSTAAAERQKGKLDNKELENFFSSASPMLTPEQRTKMRLLIDELEK